VTIADSGGASTSSAATLTLVTPAAPVPTLPAIPGASSMSRPTGRSATGRPTIPQRSKRPSTPPGRPGRHDRGSARRRQLSERSAHALQQHEFQVDGGATLQALPFGTYPKSLTAPANFLTLSSGSTNVELSGTGTIDGNGAPWWPAYSNGTIANRPRLVEIDNVTDLLITD